MATRFRVRAEMHRQKPITPMTIASGLSTRAAADRCAAEAVAQGYGGLSIEAYQEKDDGEGTP